MARYQALGLSAAVGFAFAFGCATEAEETSSGETVNTQSSEIFGGGYQGPAINTGSRALLLERSFRFNATPAGSDPDNGRAKFGVAADLETEDTTDALFEGVSMAAQGPIVSNGRSCFTCHRGDSQGFGMPAPPIEDEVDLTDPLFTGIEADAQGDPDAFDNLNDRGLFKYRPNRFNPQLPQSEGLRKVFFWRKSPRLVNVSFNHGFLMDGRARAMFETARGAVFSHTQQGDERFDDLFALPDANDMEAFINTLVSDERLLALKDPSDPMHETLKNDPFYTVPIETRKQRRGARIFERKCMSCHSTPNVFNNLDNVLPLGAMGRTVTDPAWGTAVGRMFNIGISERNAHDLRFTEPTESGFEPIYVTLAAENGDTVNHEVTIDIGLAATTRRVEDIGRFKVPQLRGVKDAAPYFHDNSAATLEEALDYHLSHEYRHSKDGRWHPIWLTHRQRRDLLEFLRIL